VHALSLHCRELQVQRPVASPGNSSRVCCLVLDQLVLLAAMKPWMWNALAEREALFVAVDDG